MPENPPPPRSFLGDIGIVWQQRRLIWKILSRADKLGFALGVIITGVVAYIQIQIAVLLGDFFNRVLKLTDQPVLLSNFVIGALAFLAGYYVLKESLQLLRRWLTTRTNARIESEMTTRLVGHLLRIDLSALAAERIGASHGRISRSVEGFVKFLKVAFADFIPAIGVVLLMILIVSASRTDSSCGELLILGADMARAQEHDQDQDHEQEKRSYPTQSVPHSQQSPPDLGS